jgi:DHA1 family inner membrane transport protein
MKKPARSINLQIGLFVLTRLVLNINTRMVYPFLAVIARGLGVDLEAISLAITARSFVGAFSPALTPFVDRYGRKFGILLGLGVFSAAVTLLIIYQTLAAFYISICVSFLAVYIFMISIQAYLGDQVPYEKRGLALAITEMGWSLAFILAMPLVGLLIASYGWNSPYIFIVGLALLAMVALAKVIPADRPASIHENGHPLNNLKRVFQSPAAIAGLTFSFTGIAANEAVNLVFGVWMEDSFGLKIAALGAASAVIGFAELGGESFSGFLVDRIGQERAIRTGLLINALVALALPWLGRSVWGALVGLFLFYISYEFTFVCSLPLMTEILPIARATFMGVNISAISLGRTFGNLLAPVVYHRWGFQANTLLALILDIAAIGALARIKLPAAELAADIP